MAGFCVAAVLLLAILTGVLLLAENLIGTVMHMPDSLDLNEILGDALTLAVGIEFVKMLVKHAPEAVVEVLLFAIAREIFRRIGAVWFSDRTFFIEASQ